jgi:hypothetical protein
MKKLASLIIIANLLMIQNSQAQSDYKSAIGGRFGIPIAGSIKHFISQAGALEGYAGFRDAGSRHEYSGANIVIGGMYQHHFPIGNIEGFKWYIGGGVLVQFFNVENNPDDYSSTGFALNGVGGVDYKIKGIPLNLSADWMPAFFLNKTYYDNAQLGYGAIAVRYVFK